MIVFAVSALDAYFHDKIKYRAGRFRVSSFPPALKRFKIELGGLANWENARRKGNVLRNWVVKYLSTRPLQEKDDIKEALRLVGIEDVWGRSEPNSDRRDILLANLRKITQWRNQITHEGDRLSHRAGGHRLRGIDRTYAEEMVQFARGLIQKIEAAFPE
jgi:hypothetical protein